MQISELKEKEEKTMEILYALVVQKSSAETILCFYVQKSIADESSILVYCFLLTSSLLITHVPGLRSG
jgi:hypothetical protein